MPKAQIGRKGWVPYGPILPISSTADLSNFKMGPFVKEQCNNLCDVPEIGAISFFYLNYSIKFHYEVVLKSVRKCQIVGENLFEYLQFEKFISQE